MSVLFGLYQPEAGVIKKNGKEVKINNPNDATELGIGMVHQHFKLIDVFTVLDNIILGAETTKLGFLQKKEARRKVEELSERYGMKVDLDAKVEDITVGMQQRVEILKMLYRDNEILIFDEPTAVLTPQEIDELMATMKAFAKEGKSILFISHKLNEIMAVADRVTVLRKGKHVGTVETKDTSKQELSNMMVGRPVQLEVHKDPAKPGGSGAGGGALFRPRERTPQARRSPRCQLPSPGGRDRLHRGHRRQWPDGVYPRPHRAGQGRRKGDAVRQGYLPRLH